MNFFVLTHITPLCHFDQRGEISELPLSRSLRRFLDKLEMTMVVTDKGGIKRIIFIIAWLILLSA